MNQWQIVLSEYPGTNSRNKSFYSCTSKQQTYFDGHAPLNLPLPVWTKTTLPPDTLQRGPVGTPHGQ